MLRPVSYLQYDARWATRRYATNDNDTVDGVIANIRNSGCGPSCMAMVIATWKNKNITPKDTCIWSLVHGYKAYRQGTYYTYFAPQGKIFGIIVKQLNGTNIRNLSSANAKIYHDKVIKALNNGDMVIACMGKGKWTSSGHFILLYGIEGNNVLINDPNSVKSDRVKNTLTLMQSQVKYYFICKKPKIDYIKESTELVNQITSKIKIYNESALINDLSNNYNESVWWVIRKLLVCTPKSSLPINGSESIYARTLKAISISDPSEYNNELLKIGKSPIFWAIKKLLDYLGIE